MQQLHVVGEFAFFIGIVLAFISGFFYESLNSDAIAVVLILLGLTVGFLSITDKEFDKFLLASIALLIAGAMIYNSLYLFNNKAVYAIFRNVVAFMAPAVIIVALKSLYSVASVNVGSLLHIVKRDGTIQVFMREKIEKSCFEAGASRQICKAVADEVSRKVRSGMTSRQVAELVHSSLKKHNAKVASSFMKKLSKKGVFRLSG
jgi:hypothetical protein